MRLRRPLTALLVFTTAGLFVELLLTRHWDGFWQVAPLALLGLVLPVAAVRVPPRAAQIVMAFCILSGLAGTILHTRGKMEFALERNAGLEGWALVRETVKGTSPPILAPGAMIAIGLLGLLTVSREGRHDVS